MSKPVRWLHDEIDRWRADELVSAEQAEKIRARYPLPSAGTPWGVIVFASAGSLIIGLGVILLFAYNWDEIPKFGKLALILSAVIGAHAGGLWLWRHDDWRRRIGEALSLLGTMFYGSAIWLIAQIYHIDEHYPNGFLIWALGALALAWALRSIPQALLATVLFTIWGCAEMWNFHQPMYWAFLVVLLGLGPLAWLQRSAILSSTVLASLYVLLITTVATYGSVTHAFTATFAFSTLLVGGAILQRTPDGEHPAGIGPWMFFGSAGFIICTYLLGFHGMADDLLNWDRHLRYRADREVTTAVVLCWSLFAAALLTWIFAGYRALQLKALRIRIEEWICPIALINTYLLANLGNHSYDRLVSAIFSLVLLGVAVMWMLRGCREARLRPTILGSLILSALVFARYFDLFTSLASRGLVFLVLGGILLGEAFYYRRQKQAQKDTGGSV